MENLWRFGGKKKHSCKFPGLQQIVELCSNPNVVETNGEGLSGTEIPAPSVQEMLRKECKKWDCAGWTFPQSYHVWQSALQELPEPEVVARALCLIATGGLIPREFV